MAAIGPYEVLEELGRGAMGAVFRARASKGHVVALKVLNEAWAAEDRERFEREAQALRSLRHPNVVTFHELGWTGGKPYLAMEFVEGETLFARLRRGPLSIPEVQALLRDLASALAHAHDQGVLHRDLKPANVLLRASGAAVLTDFGIAHHAGARSLTATGQLLGTPNYMAPEQAHSAKGLTPAVDVFSLGVLAYEALTGARPFGGENLLAVLEAIQNHAPAPPAQLVPETPPWLGELIERCLAKAPGERPTAMDVREACSASALQARPRALGRWVAPLAAALVVGAAVVTLTRTPPHAQTPQQVVDSPVDAPRASAPSPSETSPALSDTRDERGREARRLLADAQRALVSAPNVSANLARDAWRLLEPDHDEYRRALVLGMRAEQTRDEEGVARGLAVLLAHVGGAPDERGQRLQRDLLAEPAPAPPGDLESVLAYVRRLRRRGRTGLALHGLQRLGTAVSGPSAQLEYMRILALHTDDRRRLAGWEGFVRLGRVAEGSPAELGALSLLQGAIAELLPNPQKARREAADLAGRALAKRPFEPFALAALAGATLRRIRSWPAKERGAVLTGLVDAYDRALGQEPTPGWYRFRAAAYQERLTLALIGGASGKDRFKEWAAAAEADFLRALGCFPTDGRLTFDLSILYYQEAKAAPETTVWPLLAQAAALQARCLELLERRDPERLRLHVRTTRFALLAQLGRRDEVLREAPVLYPILRALGDPRAARLLEDVARLQGD